MEPTYPMMEQQVTVVSLASSSTADCTSKDSSAIQSTEINPSG